MIRGLTARYAGNKRVVGNDLRNELRPDETIGLMPVWGNDIELNDWRIAATKAGNDILKINPDLLVIVQGISFANNLKGVADKPITLEVSDRLVYSAHVQKHLTK